MTVLELIFQNDDLKKDHKQTKLFYSQEVLTAECAAGVVRISTECRSINKESWAHGMYFDEVVAFVTHN